LASLIAKAAFCRSYFQRKALSRTSFELYFSLSKALAVDLRVLVRFFREPEKPKLKNNSRQIAIGDQMKFSKKQLLTIHVMLLLIGIVLVGVLVGLTGRPQFQIVPSLSEPTLSAPTLSNGYWICQAHTNVEPITAYDIPHTETASSTGVPNINNAYLPADIFRGYCRWVANNYWDLTNYPILSFDIWCDHTMQIQIDITDKTNGGYNANGILLADTYHDGQANTPPYNSLYGSSTTMSPDGTWIVMLGPFDKSMTHYDVDLRNIGLPLSHVGQVAISLMCGHQFDMHWNIQNFDLVSCASSSQP
jgi:hypothetical protein